MRRSLFLPAVVLLALAGCTHEKPNFTYMPDMAFSPALKAQEEGSMRLPVEGTIPRGYNPYPYKDVKDAERELKNPLQKTKTVLERGKVVYNTYCIVCHGPTGLGDGYVVPKYPRPPSLQSDKIRNAPDGHIYHVVTVGQNLMPSYASQITPADRWAMIHYLRALQRSQHPSPQDVKAAEAEMNR